MNSRSYNPNQPDPDPEGHYDQAFKGFPSSHGPMPKEGITIELLRRRKVIYLPPEVMLYMLTGNLSMNQVIVIRQLDLPPETVVHEICYCNFRRTFMLFVLNMSFEEVRENTVCPELKIPERVIKSEEFVRDWVIANGYKLCISEEALAAAKAATERMGS